MNIKYISFALVAIQVQIVSTNAFDETNSNVRRVLTIEDDNATLSYHDVGMQTSVVPQSVSGKRNHRTSVNNVCTNYAVVGQYITSYCTLDPSCTCSGAYSVRENLIPARGCFHCSKPDGATCTDDHECLTRISECVDGKCVPLQCPNTSTTDGTWVGRHCTYQPCQCSGQYSVKENLDGTGCFHCSKPIGASCQADYECSTSSSCNNGKCGPLQCPNTVRVDGSIVDSYCTTANCECSGVYSVKEDVNWGGCYHCSKPDGAVCSADHECRLRVSKCNSGVCGPVNCPAKPTGRCTMNASCACNDPAFPVRKAFTYSSGKQCYSCAAV